MKEPKLILHDLLSKDRRSFSVLDVLEALSGLALAIFLWMHMIFVASIYFGIEFYNEVPEFLESYGLAQIGIPGVVILFFVHFLLAARKIPTSYKEQKTFLRHSNLLRHKDTLTWVIQVVTGMALLVVASVHFWVIISRWDITYDISVARVGMNQYLVFYIVLLLLGEIHATVGVYRLAVKWGWPKRPLASIVTTIITVTMIILGLGALYMFRNPVL